MMMSCRTIPLTRAATLRHSSALPLNGWGLLTAVCGPLLRGCWRRRPQAEGGSAVTAHCPRRHFSALLLGTPPSRSLRLLLLALANFRIAPHPNSRQLYLWCSPLLRLRAGCSAELSWRRFLMSPRCADRHRRAAHPTCPLPPPSPRFRLGCPLSPPPQLRILTSLVAARVRLLPFSPSTPLPARASLLSSSPITFCTSLLCT